MQLGAVDRLKARLAEADSRVAKTVIRAPFSGTVGLRMISPGAYVKAGTDIVRLESIGTIKADFRIPELYMSKLGSNQEIAVRLDAYPGEEFRGRIYAVEPVVDEQTRTILMRARIPNKGNKLKPGMFVRVAVTLANRPNAIIVPEQAIWPQGQDNFVYRVVDGKAALTKIQIGNRQPGTGGDHRGPQRHGYRRNRRSDKAARWCPGNGDGHARGAAGRPRQRAGAGAG